MFQQHGERHKRETGFKDHGERPSVRLSLTDSEPWRDNQRQLAFKGFRTIAGEARPGLGPTG